ncbi:MinD/ParA family protein [Paraburkholderia sp. PGU19]|uniref:nucleotide-binding protein n=1 Tax=Paraburkholderia sp. PGU19 TaxID=2735434 RepID=UPI0015DA943B|nr:MinD/ParA family protein [Paraburkholderia sp. PGU19]
MKYNVSAQVFPVGPRQTAPQSDARIIAVTGGSEQLGRTTVVVNLAIALTRLGLKVLVVDECPGSRSASATLAAIRQGSAFTPVIQGNFPHVLAAESRRPRFNTTGAHVSNPHDIDGLEPVATAGRGPDIVLIDAALDGSGGLSPLALQAQDVLVVMQLSVEAIAEAYVCMKRLRVAQEVGHFRVIVNLLDGEGEVEPVLESLRSIARDYLAASVFKAGSIAVDPCITRAVELSRSVADAFPASGAAKDFARLAFDIQSWPRPPVASRPHSAKGHFQSSNVMRDLGGPSLGVIDARTGPRP